MGISLGLQQFVFAIKKDWLNKCSICDALRDLVPLVQFKKPEKHPWRSVNFSKVNTTPWVFFTLFKLYQWYQIVQRTTFMILIKVKSRLFFQLSTL